MEKIVNSIVFREMTYADFRHINKVGGEEEGGGGQSYIDFPTANVAVADWSTFLGVPTGVGAQGRPFWDVQMNSLGLAQATSLKIFQRRAQSVSIASQKIYSRRANRVPSWHPNNGFPDDYDPESEKLVVYIIKTSEGQFWAGWFLKNNPPSHWFMKDSLKRMFEEPAGIIRFSDRGRVLFDTTKKEWPFYFTATDVVNQIANDEAIEEDLANEDVSPSLANIAQSHLPPDVQERIIKIRKRNKTLVKNLKELYGNKCQISGETLTFVKKNGELYSEVHHLIQLGESGSDSYANAIVVSPLIHRMLHYAEVTGINIDNIQNNKLQIQINGHPYEITWHPDHAATVQESLGV
jgi:5-methylcytosine-specific restriction protein A